MINWEEVLKATSEDELKEVKLWLFKENLRLMSEKREFDEVRDRFIKERVKLRDELDDLNRTILVERQRLKQDNQFFDKKMEILKAGFAQLEADRKAFEKEKSRIKEIDFSNDFLRDEYAMAAEMMFMSAKSSMEVRKRYKDLVKLYHPDNIAGDVNLIAAINKEYERRKQIIRSRLNE